VFSFPPSLVDNSDLSGYVSRRGVKSEKEVKKILIKYCKNNGLLEPFYNKKLAEHKILEFVMTLLDGTVVGIDVTNTKDLSGWAIIRKYQEKEYHKHVGELWIVVLSNAFSDEQYLKFNMESPDNVKIMSEWDLIEELQVEIDERTICKLKALDECTRRNKAKLVDKLKNRTLGEYI